MQYQKDAVIRYRAFPEYWGGKAKIDDLVFSITPDASVRWAKLQKGECHVMPYPNPADLEAIREGPEHPMLEQPGLNIGYLAYNTTKKPFDDVRVRKALNMAINKKAIIDAVYLATGIAAKNPIPPSMWSYNDDIKDDPYDPEAAKKLLAEAGYPERLRDRSLGHAGAASLQSERQAHRRADAGRPRQDRRQGRDQELRMGRVPQARCRRASTRRACSAGRATTAIRTTSCTRLLGCDSAQRRRSNIAKFCNKPFDDLVVKAKTISDQAERTKLYEQAQVIFKEQAPWFTIAHAVQLKPVRKEVIDFKLSPFGRHNFYGVDIKE